MSQFNENHGQLFNLSDHSYECQDFVEQGLNLGDYQLKFTPNHLEQHLNQKSLLQFQLKQHLTHHQTDSNHPPPNLGGHNSNPIDEISGFLESKYSHFKLKASLLDRPLVLALEQPLFIPPLAQSYLSLSRPIAFELIAHNTQAEFKLLASPTRFLRMTSYGLVTHPMLCYHWRASAGDRPRDGNEALVPMLIQNQTKQVIELRKLILYKGFLKLFKTTNYFVTNEVKLKLTSKQEGFLEYLDQPSSQHGACELIYENSGESSTKLLKLLRLVTKRGTGIEYGL